MPKQRVTLIIREVRERRYLPLTGIAQKAGITPATLSQIERGIRRPQRETLEKIARALNCEVEDLIRIEEDSPSAEDALRPTG